jgi:hypothetical protein
MLAPIKPETKPGWPANQTPKIELSNAIDAVKNVL